MYGWSSRYCTDSEQKNLKVKSYWIQLKKNLPSFSSSIAHKFSASGQDLGGWIRNLCVSRDSNKFKMMAMLAHSIQDRAFSRQEIEFIHLLRVWISDFVVKSIRMKRATVSNCDCEFETDKSSSFPKTTRMDNCPIVLSRFVLWDLDIPIIILGWNLFKTGEFLSGITDLPFRSYRSERWTLKIWTRRVILQLQSWLNLKKQKKTSWELLNNSRMQILSIWKGQRASQSVKHVEIVRFLSSVSAFRERTAVAPKRSWISHMVCCCQCRL
jgi:hypothetical protein